MRLAVSYYRRLVAGFPPRCPGFSPGLVSSRFVVGEVALRHIFLSNSTSPASHRSTDSSHSSVIVPEV
jgi:hypothetical protein